MLGASLFVQWRVPVDLPDAQRLAVGAGELEGVRVWAGVGEGGVTVSAFPLVRVHLGMVGLTGLE